MPIFGLPDLEAVPPAAPPLDRDALLERVLDDTFAEILQPRCTA